MVVRIRRLMAARAAVLTPGQSGRANAMRERSRSR
jgi:hypothetical protein